MYALVLACFCTITVNVETNTDCGIWLNGVRVASGESALILVPENEEVEIEIRYVDGDEVLVKVGRFKVQHGKVHKLNVTLYAQPPTVAAA